MPAKVELWTLQEQGIGRLMQFVFGAQFQLIWCFHFRSFRTLIKMYTPSYHQIDHSNIREMLTPMGTQHRCAFSILAVSFFMTPVPTLELVFFKSREERRNESTNERANRRRTICGKSRVESSSHLIVRHWDSFAIKATSHNTKVSLLFFRLVLVQGATIILQSSCDR